MSTSRQTPSGSAPAETAPHPVPAPSPTTGRPAPRVRLDFLDGLRGLCAVYIAFYHVHSMTAVGENVRTNWLIKIATLLTQYGYYAVPVFIVLSGFCLMLPLARTTDGRFRGGVGQYLSRRARRILPPYYFALAAAILVAVLTAPLQRTAGGHWNVSLTLPILLGHVFLLHDLFPQLGGGLDPPMWSVATEWQIYFFLPAFLLPLWRRWGPGAALAGAWAVGLLPLLLHPEFAESSHSWLLGLFAMGMTAAGINFPREPQRSARRHPWGVTASVLFALLVGVLAAYGPPVQELWVTDVLTGAAASALLVYCTLFRSLQGPRPAPPVLRFLESGALVSLGAFSYSLYLIHGPMLAILIFLLHGRVSGNSLLLLMVGMGLPLTLGASYLFYLCFERPFLNKRSAAARAKAEVVL